MAKKNNGRLAEIKERYKKKIDYRDKIPASDYHPVFEAIDEMEIGEEIKDDVWVIVRIHNGWIVKRIETGGGTVFVPE